MGKLAETNARLAELARATGKQAISICPKNSFTPLTVFNSETEPFRRASLSAP